MSAAIDLYVVCERALFETDRAWLAALAVLAALDVDGLALQVRTRGESATRRAVLARAAADATAGSQLPVLLNGEAARATRLGYAGAHWPEALIPRGAC
jgi:thiamine monophosphate synthase